MEAHRSSYILCGIDEAGRGPVLGPLVMSVVSIRAFNRSRLSRIGVKDSKSLSPAKRKKIYSKLMKLCEVDFIPVPPPKIDKWVLEKEGLNALEASTASKLLTPIQKKVEKIFIDTPSTPESFIRYLRKFDVNVDKVIAEPKADKRYPVVSAASIVAKVIRDRKIQEIAEDVGFQIGSGYPSSPKTRRSLENVLKKKPQYVRRSWKTVEKLGLKQKTLSVQD